MDPPQRGQLIAQCEVVVETVAERAQVQPTESPDPVGHVDDHDIPVRRQPGSVVELQLAGPVDERPAGDPDHHRQRCRRVRGPHGQRQARLVTEFRVVASTAHERAALRRDRPVFERIADAAPRFGRNRCGEAQLTQRLAGVRNAAPDVYTAFGGAAQPAERGVRDGLNIGDGRHTRIVVWESEHRR